MVSAYIEWNKENIGRYISYTLLGKTGKTKALLILYGVLMVLLAVCGVLSWVLTGFVMLAIFTIAGVVMIAAFTVILYFAIKKYAKDILKLNTDNNINGIDIYEKGFNLKNDGVPVAVVGWESIASVDIFRDDAYITTINGLLFIIERDKLTEGELEDISRYASENMVEQ